MKTKIGGKPITNNPIYNKIIENASLSQKKYPEQIASPGILFPLTYFLAVNDSWLPSTIQDGLVTEQGDIYKIRNKNKKNKLRQKNLGS